MNDITAFFGIDISLLVLLLDKVDPVIVIAIGLLLQKCTPLREPVCALLFDLFFLTCRYGNERECEVYIRMDIFQCFLTGRTLPAGIGIARRLTVQILGEGKCHGQVATSFRTQKQLGMRYPVLLHTADKAVFESLMTYHFPE